MATRSCPTSMPRCDGSGRREDRTMTVIRTLRYGKGYSGRLGIRCWAARITGTDNRFGLKRTFLEPTSVEREHFNRPRTIIHFSYELEVDGLYELCEEGERWFVGVWPHKDTGEPVCGRISDERAYAWARALDEGKSDREARRASKGL